MELSVILGMVAGTLTTVSFIPQFLKIWRSKSAKDLSVGMFITFSSGVLMWLIYGILKEDLPIIVANTVTLVFCVGILILKVRYSRH